MKREFKIIIPWMLLAGFVDAVLRETQREWSLPWPISLNGLAFALVFVIGIRVGRRLGLPQ